MRQISKRANKLAGRALSAFQQAHDQLDASCDLHERARALHEQAAETARAVAEQHSAAVINSQIAVTNNRKLQTKLREFLPPTS